MKIFDLIGKEPFNKGKLHSIVIDLKGQMVDVQFECGILNKDGNFKSFGVDTIKLSNQEKMENDKGIVIQEEKREFDNFMVEVNQSSDLVGLALTTLASKGISLKETGKEVL